jgi:UDP-glucose 4-epimerase
MKAVLLMRVPYYSFALIQAQKPLPSPPPINFTFFIFHFTFASAMCILVTGSSGTIGTRLAEKFLEKGISFMGIDRRENVWLPGVDEKTIHVDLLNPDWGKEVKEKPDLIIHLAANARVYKLTENPRLALENMQTTFSILEYARRNDVTKLILASSREVYGSREEGLCEEDDTSIERCENPYTASKVALETFARSYTHCYNLVIVIIRYSNVYGMYDDSDRVVPLFIRRARKGEPLVVYGRGKTLDFTHIDDAVKGTLAVMDCLHNVAGETFNIATGTGTQIADVATRIAAAYGGKSAVEARPNRAGEVMRCVCDVRRAKEALGYEPTTGVEEGIEHTIAWYDTHDQ